MARPKGSKNKSSKPKASDKPSRKTGSGIEQTNSWLNVHGQAVFLNIPEADIKITKSEYGNKIVMVTSLSAIKKLASGENQGVNLGRFED
jgi:hypothetical protein